MNLILPTSWQELTQDQLCFVFKLISRDVSTVELRAHCVLHWASIHILFKTENGKVVFRRGKHIYKTNVSSIADIAEQLRFLDDVPPFPCNLQIVGGVTSVAPDLQGVAFSTFLMCDNLYQGYLHTKDEKLLRKMASLLYPTDKKELKKLMQYELISIFYWFTSLKSYYSRRFNHFFQPSSSTDSRDIGTKLQECMDSQIRALTKGDITKEEQILAFDTLRALTELNAQAKDYEEIKKMSK